MCQELIDMNVRDAGVRLTRRCHDGDCDTERDRMPDDPTRGDYVMWWTDFVANEWMESFEILAVALTRLAVLAYCGDTNWTASFAKTPDLFAPAALRFLREQTYGEEGPKLGERGVCRHCGASITFRVGRPGEAVDDKPRWRDDTGVWDDSCGGDEKVEYRNTLHEPLPQAWHREVLYGSDEWSMPCIVCGKHLEAGVEAWVQNDALGNGENACCLEHGDPNGPWAMTLQVGDRIELPNIGWVEVEDVDFFGAGVLSEDTSSGVRIGFHKSDGQYNDGYFLDANAVMTIERKAPDVTEPTPELTHDPDLPIKHQFVVPLGNLPSGKSWDRWLEDVLRSANLLDAVSSDKEHGNHIRFEVAPNGEDALVEVEATEDVLRFLDVLFASGDTERENLDKTIRRAQIRWMAVGPERARLEYEELGFMPLGAFRAATANEPDDVLITLYVNDSYYHCKIISQREGLGDDDPTIIIAPAELFDTRDI